MRITPKILYQLPSEADWSYYFDHVGNTILDQNVRNIVGFECGKNFSRLPSILYSCGE